MSSTYFLYVKELVAVFEAIFVARYNNVIENNVKKLYFKKSWELETSNSKLRQRNLMSSLSPVAALETLGTNLWQLGSA